MSERDIYEVSNQLGGYVDESTPEDLAKFLTREAGAAAELATEIERLRAKLAEAEKLVRAADEIRSAQKSYMADRGNEAKGKAVGAASTAYDNLRAAAEWMEKGDE